MANTEQRQPVTRDRAVEKAIELADEGGIDSLSMRKLATALGIEAMSLYYHVKNRDEILDGMLDRIYAEFSTPHAGDEWRPAMRARAESTRTVLSRHPWSVSIKARTSPGPATLGHLDSTIGCLRAAGFSMPAVGHALSMIDSYTHGFVQQELSLPLDADGDIGEATEQIIAQQQAMADHFPHLAEMAETLILQPGYAFGDEFDFGLERVLDAIAAMQPDVLGPDVAKS